MVDFVLLGTTVLSFHNFVKKKYHGPKERIINLRSPILEGGEPSFYNNYIIEEL